MAYFRNVSVFDKCNNNNALKKEWNSERKTIKSPLRKTRLIRKVRAGFIFVTRVEYHDRLYCSRPPNNKEFKEKW